jgi:TRAP-type C4-dicarboxylate transport system permease small subunit
MFPSCPKGARGLFREEPLSGIALAGRSVLLLRRFAGYLDHFILAVSRLFTAIGVTILLVMMVLTATDVFLRYLFNAPIEGVYEAIELMMAVVFCFGIAYTQRQKGHVSVNLFTHKLSKKKQAMVSSFISAVSLSLFVLMTWQSFLKAHVTFISRETTYGGVGPFGHLPISPFVYLTSVACLTFCFELMVDLVKSLTEAVRK